MEPRSRVLLTSQRNQIFTTIQNRGFTPSGFELLEDASNNFAEITHKTTGYYFRITVKTRFPFACAFSPGRDLMEDTISHTKWSEVIHWFNLWLVHILRETQVPDLWDGLEGDNQLLQGFAEQSSDNLPFTQAELSNVRSALEEIKTYVIKTKELTETQKKIVEARFDDMEEAASRMGRKDWLNLVIGNLLGIAFSLALNGDSTRDLFGFAALVIKRVLGAMLYLAGPH